LKNESGGDEEGVAAIAYKGCEGGIDLVGVARVQSLNLQPDCGSSRLGIFQGSLGDLNIARIYEHAQASDLWQ